MSDCCPIDVRLMSDALTYIKRDSNDGETDKVRGYGLATPNEEDSWA